MEQAQKNTLTKVRNHSSGFTLIEIMMVLMLIAILAGIGVTKFADFSGDAKTAVTKDRINAIKTAIMGDARFVSAGQYTKQGYSAHCGGPPAQGNNLADLITMPAAGTCSVVYNPFTQLGWRGPYVSNTDPKWNYDAWDVLLEYYVAGPPARTIRSCGPDKVCGNADDISVTY